MKPRTSFVLPDPRLAEYARQSLEEAALIGEHLGLTRAIERFDVDMVCAALWAVDEMREAGRAELHRQDRRRRIQLMNRRTG